MPPAAKTVAPAPMTTAGPYLASSRPVTRNVKTGTMTGPGATPRPVFSADQPHTSCIQSTIDSSIAPNDTEKSSVATEAPQGEEPEHDRGRGQDTDGRGRAPAPGATTDQSQGQPGHAGGHEHRRQLVGSPARMSWHVWQPAPADQQSSDADRHVHEKHPAPAGSYQEAAYHRAERGGHPAGGCPGPHRAAAPLGRIAREHEAK